MDKLDSNEKIREYASVNAHKIFKAVFTNQEMQNLLDEIAEEADAAIYGIPEKELSKAIDNREKDILKYLKDNNIEIGIGSKGSLSGMEIAKSALLGGISEKIKEGFYIDKPMVTLTLEDNTDIISE